MMQSSHSLRISLLIILAGCGTGSQNGAGSVESDTVTGATGEDAETSEGTETLAAKQARKPAMGVNWIVRVRQNWLKASSGALMAGLFALAAEPSIRVTRRQLAPGTRRRWSARMMPTAIRVRTASAFMVADLVNSVKIKRGVVAPTRVALMMIVRKVASVFPKKRWARIARLACRRVAAGLANASVVNAE